MSTVVGQMIDFHFWVEQTITVGQMLGKTNDWLDKRWWDFRALFSFNPALPAPFHSHDPLVLQSLSSILIHKENLRL